MRKNVVGAFVLLGAVLFGLSGCGGSSGTTATDAHVKKTVTGSISFPVVSATVAKQVAAATVAPGTVIPPTLTITDLSGNPVVAPALTVDPTDPQKYTYSTSIDPVKNYVLTASWGGQVLRTLADQTTLSQDTVVNITPVSTAAVLVAEQKLNLAAGQLGTAAASAVTASQFAEIKPAVLIATVESGAATTYAPLVTAVTSTLTSSSDPTKAATVIAAVSAAPPYTAPLSFTVAMISGKTFTEGTANTVTFNANGTMTASDTTDTLAWSVNASGQIVVVDSTSNTRTTVSLISGTVDSVMNISLAHSDGTTETSTFTVKAPSAPSNGFTVTMVSGKTFTEGSVNTVSFNANGTLIASDTTDALTWSVNSSGQIVVDNSTSHTSTTVTLVSGTIDTVMNISLADSDGTTSISTFTLKTASAPSSGFTVAMISGKAFTEGTVNTVTFNANGTMIASDTTDTLTWSVNASGQIVVVNSTSHTSTIVTLVSGTIDTVMNISLANSDGTTDLSTFKLKI